MRNLDSHAHPPSKEPSSKNARWVPTPAMREKYPQYTVQALPFPRTGGRGPNGIMMIHGMNVPSKLFT